MWLKGYRIVFVTLAYCLMFIKPASSQSYFTGLLIFAAGLVYDYFSIYVTGKFENDTYHKYLGLIGGILAIIYLIISLFGLTDVIELNIGGKNILVESSSDLIFSFGVNLNILLVILSVFVFLAGFEMYGEHKRNFKNCSNPNEVTSQA